MYNSRRRTRNSFGSSTSGDTPGCGFYLAMFILLGLCCGGAGLYRANYNNHVTTCTVESKDRGMSHDGKSHYRVYTKQCGVLANEDQMFVGKFNSADIQGQLEPGHTYRLRVTGWRLPFFSSFPNIISVEGEVPA